MDADQLEEHVAKYRQYTPEGKTDDDIRALVIAMEYDEAAIQRTIAMWWQMGEAGSQPGSGEAPPPPAPVPAPAPVAPKDKEMNDLLFGSRSARDT